MTLQEKNIDILFFGGKGGVGKSTTSTATAIYLAKLNPKKKILLISFDMAHNLSDLFDTEIGDKITDILPNLWAIEPDAERYTEEFVAEFVEKSKELAYMMPLAKKITNIEEYIDESFSAASIPLAVKNSIFFEEVITNSDQFDVFVIDMPPTGNMISIFEVPKTTIQVFLKSTLETMDKVMDFIQGIRNINPINWFRNDHKKRRNIAKELVEMLKELDRRGDKINHLLQHNSSLRFVSIPERPSFEEIKRANDLVQKYVPLDGVVINKINPEGFKCKICERETENQKKYVKLIEEHFHGKTIWKSNKMEDEVIGMDQLLSFAKNLYGDENFNDILHPSFQN